MKPWQKKTGGTLAFASLTLMAFLGVWEGNGQYVVYADRLANGLPTVCRGLTHWVTSTPIVVGERWSADKCAEEEQKAVTKVQLQLVQCFAIEPPQRVFDAASSHAWNNGAAATCSSQAMRAWNAGNWARGCRRLQLSDAGRPVWSFTRQNGKMVFTKGLANRRGAERTLCTGSN